jgi:hypothetical protein
VAKDFLNGYNVDAVPQHMGCRIVPKIVKTEVFYSGPLLGHVKRISHKVSVRLARSRVRKHIIRLAHAMEF